MKKNLFKKEPMKKLKNLEAKCLVQLRKMKLNQYSQQDQERIIKRIEYEETEIKKYRDNWYKSTMWKAAILNLFRKGVLKPTNDDIELEVTDLMKRYSKVGTTNDRCEEEIN